MTTDDAACVLGVSAGALQDWRYLGRGPAFVRVEGQIRYRLSELVAYIERNTTSGGAAT
ncbi:MAG: hypothetical protein JWN99_2561 [Ilumatobacteraceae bacterium]|nr:hypothetical protein [Ilumatobacteraceae bacterium]